MHLRVTLRALYSSRVHSIPSTAVEQGAVKRVLLYPQSHPSCVLFSLHQHGIYFGGTLACSACRSRLLLDRVSSTARAPWASMQVVGLLSRHVICCSCLFMLSFVCISVMAYRTSYMCSGSAAATADFSSSGETVTFIGDGWLIGRSVRPLSASIALSLWVSLMFFPCSSNSTVYD